MGRVTCRLARRDARLLDEPDLLPRLRAGVRPPMTMEKHVDRPETLYASVTRRNPCAE